MYLEFHADSMVMKNRGFTLIELLIVLFVAGLLSALVAPTISRSLTNLKFKAAVKHLSAVLRYARTKAVSGKHTTQVIIDIDNASYSAQTPTGDSDDEGSGSTAFPQGVSFREVKIGEDIQSSGQVRFLFYPKGNTSGGEIILENASGQMYKITIDTLLGKVTISR